MKRDMMYNKDVKLKVLHRKRKAAIVIEKRLEVRSFI